jgi:hypothetical protein
VRTTGLAVCLGCVIVPAALARPTTIDASDLARATLTRRQQIPAVRYELRWERFPPRLPPGAPKPGEDGAYTGTGLVVLDVPGGRIRADWDERTPIRGRAERLSRIRESIRFDGWEQTAYSVTDWDAAAAPAEPAVGRVFAGEWGRSARWPYQFVPLAWAHGLVVPATGIEVGPFPATWRPAEDRFTVSCVDVVGGRARVVVVFRDQTAVGRPFLWVDPADGAVLRSFTPFGKGGGTGITMRYQDTPHGRLRLPAGWEYVAYSADEPAAVVERVTVTAVRFDPPLADDFRVPLRPGMTVEREGRTWRVSADGELVSLPAADAPPPVAQRTPPPPVDLLHVLQSLALLTASAGLVVGLLYVRWRWLRITW